eukprot:1380391-Heterocapsa_arctica.AAC.1
MRSVPGLVGAAMTVVLWMSAFADSSSSLLARGRAQGSCTQACHACPAPDGEQSAPLVIIVQRAVLAQRAILV